MFGLNFVQQGFLLATAAAVIPIAIHLLLRQRARRVDIGSVRFLQRVVREHNRMRRLRQWLLLAVRVLATLVLALLFARPFFDRTAADASQREVVFLLDCSASMQLTHSSQDTIFAEAYQAVRRELEQVHENTVVRVALFNEDDVTELDWGAEEPAPEPSYAGTDFGKALAWARDTLEQSDRPVQEVVLFTDLQRTGIGPTQLDQFPSHVRLRLRDFGMSMARNLAVSRAAAIATEIRPKMPPTVQVEIRNGGATSVPSVSVRLNLDGPAGRTRMTRSVAVPAGGRGSTEFAIEDAAPGLYEGYVEVAYDDELDFDNRRYLAFEARRPDRVLLVDGQEGSSVFGNETYFMETALQLGKDVSHRGVPTFETERIVWDNGEGFPNLAGFRVVALANIGHFSKTDARRLGQYLAEGGRVLIYAGDKFTRRAARPLAEAGIMPAELIGTRGLGPYRVGSWVARHPLLQPFDDPQHGDLRRLSFHQLAAVQPNSNAQVLIETTSGDPLLVEGAVGTGRVLLFASTTDTAWSDWPQGRLFVPLTRQIFAYLTDQHLRESRIVEAPVTDQPGIVTKKDILLLKNVTSEESELARVSTTEFRQAMHLPEEDELADMSPEELASLAPPADGQRPSEIWHVIAWILLGLLVSEVFLAGRVHA